MDFEMWAYEFTRKLMEGRARSKPALSPLSSGALEASLDCPHPIPPLSASATHIQASVHDGLPDPFATMKRLQAERPRTEFDYLWERPEPDANTSPVGKVVASAIWYISVREAQQRQDAFMASWNAHQTAEQAERAKPVYAGKWPIPSPKGAVT